MVRVGSNEVWFDSKEAFRIIYSEFCFCVRVKSLDKVC